MGLGFGQRLRQCDPDTRMSIQRDLDAPCPCREDRSYGQCCAPLHAGQTAADAETLMRSRYSAYALEMEDYLLASWHPDTRPRTVEFEAASKWLGLTIKDHQILSEDESTVSFVARFRVAGGRAVRMQERSRFRRESGRWYYIDALSLS
tara:strand:- start:1727 stop:2173 length:447 start_codon:yes stop_codon:yes gene_type:complete